MSLGLPQFLKFYLMFKYFSNLVILIICHISTFSFYALISKFKSLTGCPVVVNTSFNVRGEPIVCSPEDASRCFMGTELDLLVVGNSLLRKTEQDEALKVNYKKKYALD